MRRNKFWVLLVVALALGLLVGWVDSRPNWDDTGITAGLVLLAAGLLGMAMPERAWVWALAMGAWIPLLGISLQQNYSSLLALAIAFVGAYAGAAARKVLGVLSGVTKKP